MFDVFQLSEFARPCSIRKLPRSVCGTAIYSENGHFFHSHLKSRILALFKSEPLEDFGVYFHCILSRHTFGPIVLTKRIRFPPTGIISCGPSDTVVIRLRRAGDLVCGITKPWEQAFQIHQRNPFLRPHFSQSWVISATTPRCLGSTGSSRAIDLSAQNQCSGLCSSSLRINGSACGPMPMICWYAGCRTTSRIEER